MESKNKTGYVYKLCIRDGSVFDCYIGSTYNVRRRKNQHKECCTNENSKSYNRFMYQFIRDNNGWDNWCMHILEKLDNIDRLELKKMERKYIEELTPSLNKQLPTRTQVEWRQVHKDDKQQYDKVYRQIKINCPQCGHLISLQKKLRHEKSIKHQKRANSI